MSKHEKKLSPESSLAPETFLFRHRFPMDYVSFRVALSAVKRAREQVEKLVAKNVDKKGEFDGDGFLMDLMDLEKKADDFRKKVKVK